MRRLLIAVVMVMWAGQGRGADCVYECISSSDLLGRGRHKV